MSLPQKPIQQHVKYDRYSRVFGDILWDSRFLHVGFIGGDLWQRQQVKSIAVEWNYIASSIEFNFDDTFRGQDPYDILVVFDEDKGSNSVLRNLCRKRAEKGEASMDLGWVRQDIDQKQVRRTILHEFGHTLGLGHMHQNPWGAGRPELAFDEAACYKFYSNKSNWNQEKVDRNILLDVGLDYNKISQANKSRMIYLMLREFHADSIMMYELGSQVLKGGKGGTKMNWGLSNRDKHIISLLYPLTGRDF